MSDKTPLPVAVDPGLPGLRKMNIFHFSKFDMKSILTPRHFLKMLSSNSHYHATYLLMATVKPADEWAHGQTTSLRRPFPSNVFTNESQAAKDPEKY